MKVVVINSCLIDAMDFWTNVSNGGKWNFIGVLGIKVRAIF